MPPHQSLIPIFEWIEENKNHQIALLRQAVEIPSVSAWPVTHHDHLLRCARFFSDRLRLLGFSTDMRKLPLKHYIENQEIELPPIVLARLPQEELEKKTVLIYGHLDVQPAIRSDGWDSEPFEFVEKDGKLFGRGTTDDKGPVMAWTNAIEAVQKAGKELPVNIRFILESMEESGSEGLEQAIKNMKNSNDPFFEGIDYCVISDSYWLGNTKPCVAYGLRGINTFSIDIACADQDLHSGCRGGLVYEAMTDLVYLLDQLVDKDGRLLITGIMEKVRPMTQDEADMYKLIDFDLNMQKNEIGASKFIHEDDCERTLQSLWRFPCLSIHGIEGAFSEKGFKTVIPHRVKGKFSIRTVPDMSIEDTNTKVLNYLNELWRKRNSPNNAKFHALDSGHWYYADPHSPNFLAARNAMKAVFNIEPDLIREGGSIPITLVLQECTGKDVCLLPIGCSDDGAHSQNEKINTRNYIDGAKVMAAYLFELARL